MDGKRKRLNLIVDSQLYYDMEAVCRLVGKQRDKHCSKSELASIALTAFICTFYDNLKEKEN